MGRFPDATITTVLDFQHLSEFQFSWPVCVDRWPELNELPLHFYVDAAESVGWWASHLSRFITHDNVRIFPIPRTTKVNQRHRMLSAFVLEASRYVETPWTLKIDTDAVCGHRDERFAEPKWFTDENNYAFISSKWGYTRPTEMWLDLLEWAETRCEFDGYEQVPGTVHTKENPPPPGMVFTEDRRPKVTHGRVISYVQWTRTEFLRLAAELCPGNFLPIPSQDTFLWYVAHRLGLPYARVRMGKLGWAHGRKKIRPLYDKIFPATIGTIDAIQPGGSHAGVNQPETPEFK